MPINKATSIVTELDEVSDALIALDTVGVGADIVTIDSNIANGVDAAVLTTINSDIDQLEIDIQDLNNNSGGVLDTVNSINAVVNNNDQVINSTNSFPLLRAIAINRNIVLRAGSTGLTNIGSFIDKFDIETSSMQIFDRKSISAGQTPLSLTTGTDVAIASIFGKGSYTESMGKVFADGVYLIKPKTFYPNFLYSLINNISLVNPNTGDVTNIHQPLGAAYANDNGTTNWVDGGESVGVAYMQYDPQTSEQLVSYSIAIDGYPGKHVFTRYAGGNVLQRKEVDLGVTNVTYLKNVIYDNDNDCYYGVIVEMNSTVPSFTVGTSASVIKVDSNFDLVWRTPTICSYTTGTGSNWSIFAVAPEVVYKLSVDQSTSTVYMLGHSSDSTPYGNIDSIYKIDNSGNLVSGDTTALPYSPSSAEPNGKDGDIVMLSNAAGKQDVVLRFIASSSSSGTVQESQFYNVDMIQEELAMFTNGGVPAGSRGTYSGTFNSRVQCRSITRISGTDLFFCSFDISQGIYDITNDSNTNYLSTLRVIGVSQFILDSSSGLVRPKLLNYTVLNTTDIMAIGRI